MRGNASSSVQVLQGTLEEPLQLETGSLYPALHRLEAKGWVAPSWGLSNNGELARFYRLTPLGRKRDTFSRAMALILNPVDQEAQ